MVVTPSRDRSFHSASPSAANRSNNRVGSSSYHQRTTTSAAQGDQENRGSVSGANKSVSVRTSPNIRRTASPMTKRSTPGRSPSQRPTASSTARGSQRPTASSTARGSQRPTASSTARGSQRPTASSTARGSQRPTASSTARGSQRPTSSSLARGSQRPTTLRRSPSPVFNVKQHSSKTLTSRRTVNLNQAGLRESAYDEEDDEVHPSATSDDDYDHHHHQTHGSSPPPTITDAAAQRAAADGWTVSPQPSPSEALEQERRSTPTAQSSEALSGGPSSSPEVSTTTAFAAGGGRASRRSTLLQNNNLLDTFDAEGSKELSDCNSAVLSPGFSENNGGRKSSMMMGEGRPSMAGRFTLSTLPAIDMDHFDQTTTARWLGQVLSHCEKKIPADIEAYVDENRGVAPPQTNEYDLAASDADCKLSPELYKRLFLAHQGFAEMDDQNGLLLVATAWEDLLKIRPRLRDGRCVCVPAHTKTILDKFYPELVQSLGPKYPALERQVEARRRRPIEGLDLSDYFLDQVTKWKQTQSLLDVLSAPCDTTTFAGVVGHGDLQMVAVAKAVVQEDVVEAVCEQMMDAEHCGDWARLGDLWRLLEEALYVCVEAFESTRVDMDFNDAVFMDILLRNKLLGRICKAAQSRHGDGATSADHVAQRCAVNTLDMLAHRGKSRNVLAKLMKDFPDALRYLLPCLYEEDVGVQTQCCEGLIALFEDNRRALLPIYFTYQDYFKHGLEEALDPTSLCRLAEGLMVPNYYRLDNQGREYIFFHRELLCTTVSILHKVNSSGARKNAGTSKRRQVALVQYLTALFTANPIEDFVQLAVQLQLPEYVQDQLQTNSRITSTRGGVNWGTHNKLFNALNDGLKKVAADQKEGGYNGTPSSRNPGSSAGRTTHHRA